MVHLAKAFLCCAGQDGKDGMEGRPVAMAKRLTTGLGIGRNAGSLAPRGCEVQAVGSTKTKNIMAKGLPWGWQSEDGVRRTS